MYKILLLISLLLSSFNTYAKPSAPQLQINTEGLQATLEWSKVDSAQGYLLSYAPYPFQGVDTIGSIEMASKTDFSIELWQQAAYYVVVQAYDKNHQQSEYSNIGFILISGSRRELSSFLAYCDKRNQREIFHQ